MNHLPSNSADTVSRVLQTAHTYYENRDKLIYSYGGRTFLAGYPLYDETYDSRGNIDCSTYMHLVLQGITYQESPYALGKEDFEPNHQHNWIQPHLYENWKQDENKRRANEIARTYYEAGLCFEDPNLVRPGDLVFYRAPEESIAYYLEHNCFMGICHIAMAAEQKDMIYHSTGLPEKEDQESQHIESVQIISMYQDRTPILFARPDYHGVK